MNLNITVNESGNCTPSTPGSFQVRAFYDGQQDAGHEFGPFSTREAAEQCANTLAGRDDVASVVIETL